MNMAIGFLLHAICRFWFTDISANSQTKEYRVYGFSKPHIHTIVQLEREKKNVFRHRHH